MAKRRVNLLGSAAREAQLNLRCHPRDLDRWRKRARREGYATLSDWIRRALDDRAGGAFAATNSARVS